MVRSRWMMWLVSQSLVWTDFTCVLDIGMKLFVFIHIVVYNSCSTICLFYGILSFNYLSLSDFISCVFMRITISIVLIDGESKCVVFWIRLFVVGSWMMWFMMNWGMIRSRCRSMIRCRSRMYGNWMRSNYRGMIRGGGRMDRYWMGSYDRSVVRGGGRSMIRSWSWGMVWGWCRSMIRSWGWGMVWGRCRNWGMVRCRSWSMVWLMWYVAECCEWNWMFICRYCRYHSHNCGKENLHIWNISYHVLPHKFDGVHMLQQFKIVA